MSVTTGTNHLMPQSSAFSWRWHKAALTLMLQGTSCTTFLEQVSLSPACMTKSGKHVPGLTKHRTPIKGWSSMLTLEWYQKKNDARTNGLNTRNLRESWKHCKMININGLSLFMAWVLVIWSLFVQRWSDHNREKGEPLMKCHTDTTIHILPWLSAFPLCLLHDIKVNATYHCTLLVSFH